VEPGSVGRGSVRLRPAVVDDAEAIGRYHHRCWVEGFTSFVDADLVAATDADALVALWRERLAGGGVDVVVAVEPDDRVAGPEIGPASGRPVAHLWVEGGVITNLFVDPSWWRRGLGRELLRVGEERLRDGGIDVGELWTIVGNERALAFYGACGWTPDGAREWHVSSLGIPVEELRLTKVL
jgi:GNAT superfamily N-acetyltransferase